MISERLKALRAEKGMAQIDVSRMLGVSQQAYSNYEAGRREPDIKSIEELSKYFAVTTDYLLGLTDVKSAAPDVGTALSADELQLVEDYRELNDDGQSFVRATVHSLVSSGTYIKNNNIGQAQIS